MLVLMFRNKEEENEIIFFGQYLGLFLLFLFFLEDLYYYILPLKLLLARVLFMVGWGPLSIISFKKRDFISYY